jgi:hypothetical protein
MLPFVHLEYYTVYRGKLLSRELEQFRPRINFETLARLHTYVLQKVSLSAVLYCSYSSMFRANKIFRRYVHRVPRAIPKRFPRRDSLENDYFTDSEHITNT